MFLPSLRALYKYSPWVQASRSPWLSRGVTNRRSLLAEIYLHTKSYRVVVMVLALAFAFFTGVAPIPGNLPGISTVRGIVSQVRGSDH